MIPDPRKFIEDMLLWALVVAIVFVFATPVAVTGMHFYAAFNPFEVPDALNGIAGLSAIFALLIAFVFTLHKVDG